MSVTSNNSFHRRNDSGEIVVFDAARYFSGVDENPCYHNSGRTAARMSLDMPSINAHNLPTIQKQYLMREKKKYKLPSSPGGRLASFLNSLFNQTNSKKKKKYKTSAATADDKDDHNAHYHRRSSISHFRITTSSADDYCDSNSAYSAAPSSYAKTPTKSSYKDFKSFSDRQKAASLLKNGESVAGNERLRFNDGSFRNPTTKWTDNDDHGKFGDVDAGEDSDSSSDLFDLPNLDFYLSGLPVYGTTDMDSIRLGAPVFSAAAM